VYAQYAAIALVSMAITAGSRTQDRVDLAIRDATVLDVRSGRLLEHTTILITGDRIQAVVAGATANAPVPRRTIDARGRLVTPGIIDCHFHSGMVLGDSVTPTNGYITHLVMRPDSIGACGDLRSTVRSPKPCDWACIPMGTSAMER
jgi:hypothetical protein